MIKDMARGALAESTFQKSIFTRAKVNIYDIKLKNGDEPSTNPHIKLTNMNYYVKYSPKPFKAKGKPFILVSDILKNGRMRFSGWEVLEHMSKTDPEIQWLFRNTPLCKEHLIVAGENIDMVIPFSLNIPEYEKKIRAQFAEEEKSYKYFSVFRTPQENETERLRYNMYLETKKKGASKLV